MLIVEALNASSLFQLQELVQRMGYGQSKEKEKIIEDLAGKDSPSRDSEASMDQLIVNMRTVGIKIYH